MALTYTLLDDADGQFSLDGSAIKVASALTAGTQQISVRATDSNGWSKDKTFDISVAEFANAEAEAFVSAMGVAPDAARKAAIDTFFSSIKFGATSETNILAKMDAMYLLASHDADAALINAAEPGSFDCLKVNAPNFVADRGYSGGTNKALNTQLVPSTLVGKMSQNNAHISLWDLTARAADTTAQMGTATPELAIYTRLTGDLAYTRVNDNTVAGKAVTENEGFLLGTRGAGSGAGAVVVYKDGVSIGTDSAGSVAPSDDPVYILGRFVNGTLSTPTTTDRIAFASVGSNLTTDEVLDLYNAVAAYLTAVGAI